MEALFVRRSAFEALERFCDTERWRLKSEIRTLREREAARVVCVEALEKELAAVRRERDALELINAELEEKVRLLDDKSRALRMRYDATRAELARVKHDNTELTLMKNALEARVAAPCEVEA